MPLITEKNCLTQAVDVNVLEWLLSKGAGPNEKIGIKRYKYTYPIHSFLSTEFENMLLKKWRNLENHAMSNSSLSNEIKDFVECLLRHGAQVDLKDDMGRTALHIAASKNHSVTIVKLLIDSGAVVNQTDNKGETPLRKALSIKNAETIECLLRHGAHVDLQYEKGRTALHMASNMYNSVPIAQLLIEFGADVNKTDNFGETPLRIAVENEDTKMVEYLIKSGADYDLLSKSTGKPFTFELKNDTILKILLDNGMRVKPIDGESPLNSLLAKRHIGVENVKRLIDAGCNVNHVNKDGDSVLIHAAKYVDIGLLELLVLEGADVNASGRKFPYKTALTSLLIKLWNDPEEATLCINFLLNQYANIDKVHPGGIHVFITSGCLSLIPRFISCGLPPTSLSIKDSRDPRFTFNTCFSPLLMAFVLNQLDLVKYFININYLMKSDIDVLYVKWDSQIPIDQATLAKGLRLLNKIVQGPLSLETLCLIVISDSLGHTQDRRLMVRKLGIPQTLQNALLFKNATTSDIEDVNEENLYYFKHSLQQLNLYHVDSDDEDDTRFFDDGNLEVYW